MKEIIRIRNKDGLIVKTRVRTIYEDESLTEPQHKDKTDINKIVEKAAGGLIIPKGTRQFYYGDFTSGNDFQETVNKQFQARERFNALPPEIRKEFNNSPAELMNFLSDDNNYDKAVEMGFIEEKPKEIVQKVEVINKEEDKVSP